MTLDLNGFVLDLSLLAWRDGGWITLPLAKSDQSLIANHREVRATLKLSPTRDRCDYEFSFTAPFRTRLRLQLALHDDRNLFHLIPGNIHGDNNAAHVRAGEFPCLTTARPAERNCAPLWEFRADRASHPVSMLCCERGAVGISIDPYSPCQDTEEGFLRNGVYAALPNVFGVSLGYGNDPLTFVEKTHFRPATADLSHGASVRGTIHACRGDGRREAHGIIRALYDQHHHRPSYRRSPSEALRALADSFATVNWSLQLRQYTNRKCRVPVDRTLEPWRAIVEIGWTGGSMLAYPFALAEQIFPDLVMPKTSTEIFDEICGGWNEVSGFINDTTLNRSTLDRPSGWNDSKINGWWSGFLPQTREAHCAYTNAHAAYYLLKTADFLEENTAHRWTRIALHVLETAMSLQRDDGAFGYIFSSKERRVIDYEGFAGCWFAAALARAWRMTNDERFRNAADRALSFYYTSVRDLVASGTPMDTFKSIDSEGNLAFIRAARLMHETTGEAGYLDMLTDGAHYEYLWRYGFRARPQCEPLKGSHWNSCGGTITSISNPHIHPMGVVATDDLDYLARISGNAYHQDRAEDGIAWLMNTMELYPDVVGYGQYGVLSERTCPSDGLLAEVYHDDQRPASTWWSYNAWAAGSAMEALAERIRSRRNSTSPASTEVPCAT